MSLRSRAIRVLLVFVLGLPAVTAAQAPPGGGAAAQTVRVTGTVRDETNGITLPGVPVETESGQVVYTDVDGRYVLQLAPGAHQLKITLEGYEAKTVSVTAGEERTMTVDVGLRLAKFASEITVTAKVVDAETSSAEAQLIERVNAPVITDNIGSQEMRRSGDSDAAAAMARVPGLSVVDNQYVFVRGLGERYSNTTLAGSVIPTTEPDKKVVPLDMFPSGLLDSVQVAKSYSPDKSAEFAGGLVQIVPMKLPATRTLNLNYGISRYSTATGKSIPLSPLGSRDGWGYDNGSRALPSAFPSNKIVRGGIFTPDVGYSAEQITEYGRMLNNVWRPVNDKATPGQDWSVAMGDRFGKLGIVASASHTYKEQYLEETRRFYRIAGEGELEATNDYQMQSGLQKAQLGIVANASYQFNPGNRLTFENFYTHTGRDEGRYFEGDNRDNARNYRNYRLQFIEEGLFSNAVGGEHFFQNLTNSRLDWRVNFARADRDEPDLRETLYERALGAADAVPFTYADESQSGFRMFTELNDDTLDAAFNWSLTSAAGGRPTQYKFGFNYVDRERDFTARRFHFIPITTQKADTGNLLYNPLLPPEELFVSDNIGTAFRFNEETRPVDAYVGDQSTAAFYGMVDLTLTNNTRLVTGLRVENFDQTVITQDPFGLFARSVTAENNNTDLFPAVNLVQALNEKTNLRVSYSTTVNRPEFRELAEFEFTDVVGNRAVKGNPDLNRALIQNIDGRYEYFSGGRNVLAASVFYKYFDQPIERVVIASANPIATFQNADKARNFGIELEAGQQFGRNVFVSSNYTFVDSKITLLPEQRTVQTSQERALAGQSRHLFNVMAEYTIKGFSSRLLYNYFGDRISDVGANGAPDVVEQGRGALDMVFSQRIRDFGIRLTLENLTDDEYEYTQTLTLRETQRLYQTGRAMTLSFGYNVF